MKARTLLMVGSLAVLASCVPSEPRIDEVMDLPLKTTERPEWETGLLRANANYMLFGAVSEQDRQNLLGDYYFVTWSDVRPDLPARLVFRYTQARTGSRVLESIVDYRSGRQGGEKHEAFAFNGPDRRVDGDILTWKLLLEVDGKVVDSKQSFLWE